MGDKDTDDKLDKESLLVLGELARGITHDLKNFLTAIQGNAELALRANGNEKNIERAMSMIMRATLSARDLCNQVLSYTQEKSLPRSVFDLREVLEEAEMLIAPAVPESIKLTIVAGDEPMPIEASHSQILQIILNLLSNSIHAIADEKGEIELKLIGNGTTCTLIAKDNGPGIASEHREHLFQPGYTTKIYGLATGLGLALVSRIAKEHSGSVELDSAIKQGACFKVSLPLTQKAVEKSPIKEYAIKKERKKHNILLIDDEEFMRSLGIDILQTLGYRVTVCESAKSASELIQKSPDYFDVILSDSRMPEMTGEELAAKLLKLKLNIPFVLVTAFAVSESKDDLKTNGIHGVVAKPFLIDDLRKALNSALESRS